MSTIWEGGHCHNSSRVQVVDRDRLILVTVVLNDTLDQNVEWSTQEDIVCGVVNDVELHIQRNVSDKDWDVVGQTQSLIHFTIC